MNTLKFYSAEIKAGGAIPEKYTCNGSEISPPLNIEGVSDITKSLAIIVDDSDIPKEIQESMKISKFNHWLLCDIPPETSYIAEGSKSVGISGKNSYGKNEYAGPCPPTEYEPTTHRYLFKLFSLDCVLDLKTGYTEDEFIEKIEGHIVDSAEFYSTFDRTD